MTDMTHAIQSRLPVAAAALLALAMLSTAARAERECALPRSEHSAIEEICAMHEGMARFKIDGRWGYVDAAGRIAVAPGFDEAGDFAEGLASAQRDEKWGFIDKAGQWAVEPRFTSVFPFTSGRAAVEQDGKWGFIDPQGRWVVEPKFDSAGPFHGNAAVVSEGPGRDLMIDTRGEVIRRFPANISVSRYANAFGLFDAKETTGTVLQHLDGRTSPMPPSVPYANGYAEGLLPATQKAERNGETVELHGTMDLQGRWVTPPTFRGLDTFHSGIAVASLDGEHLALVDRQGKPLTPFRYARISRETQGWYTAVLPGDAGTDILDKRGSVLLSTPCTNLSQVSLMPGPDTDWVVLSGCEQSWVLRPDGALSKSGLATVEASATATHLLLSEAEHGERPQRFELYDRASGKVLSSEDPRFTATGKEPTQYDHLVLLGSQPPSEGRSAAALPVALVVWKYETVGLVTSDYRVVSNPEWTYPQDFPQINWRETHEGPLPMHTDRGWGAVDGQGRWVIAPTYRELTTFEHGLAFARTADRRVQLVDAHGKTYPFLEGGRRFSIAGPFKLVGFDSEDRPVRYDPRTGQVAPLPPGTDAGDFHEGLAALEREGRWGLVDESGQWVVPPRYTSRIEAVLDDKKGLLGWKTGRSIETDRGTETLYGWLDAKGKELAEPRYSEIRHDADAGVVFLTEDGLFHGVMTLDGRLFAAPVHETVTHLGDGWFELKKRDLQGLLKPTGEWSAKPAAHSLEDLQRRPYAMEQRGDHKVLVDTEGRVSTRDRPQALAQDQPQWWWPQAEGGYENRTTVFYGFDFKPKARIPGEVESYEGYSDDVVVFKQHKGDGTRMGLADAQGRVLGVYPYESIAPMRNGFAVFGLAKPLPRKTAARRPAATEDEPENGVRFGYLRRDGKPAIAPTFEAASDFSEERAVVVSHGNLGLIDTQGRVLLQGAWQCGRQPVLVDGGKRVLWPAEAAKRKKC